MSTSAPATTASPATPPSPVLNSSDQKRSSLNSTMPSTATEEERSRLFEKCLAASNGTQTFSTRGLFFQFLKSRFNHEMLLFMDDVKPFQKIPGSLKEEKFKRAMALVDKYIKNDAENELNLPAAVKRDTLQQLESYAKQWKEVEMSGDSSEQRRLLSEQLDGLEKLIEKLRDQVRAQLYGESFQEFLLSDQWINQDKYIEQMREEHEKKHRKGAVAQASSSSSDSTGGKDKLKSPRSGASKRSAADNAEARRSTSAHTSSFLSSILKILTPKRKPSSEAPPQPATASPAPAVSSGTDSPTGVRSRSNSGASKHKRTHSASSKDEIASAVVPLQSPLESTSAAAQTAPAQQQEKMKRKKSFFGTFTAHHKKEDKDKLAVPASPSNEKRKSKETQQQPQKEPGAENTNKRASAAVIGSSASAPVPLAVSTPATVSAVATATIPLAPSAASNPPVVTQLQTLPPVPRRSEAKRAAPPRPKSTGAFEQGGLRRSVSAQSMQEMLKGSRLSASPKLAPLGAPLGRELPPVPIRRLDSSVKARTATPQSPSLDVASSPSNSSVSKLPPVPSVASAQNGTLSANVAGKPSAVPPLPPRTLSRGKSLKTISMDAPTM